MNLASAAILALAMPTDAFAATAGKGASLQETRWSQALQTGAIFGFIEARLLRSDLRCLAAMAAFGAVLGPMSLIWGLQRTSGTNTSLMLTLEAVFTAILACRLYQETMDRHVCSQTSIRTCMTMAKPRAAICPAQIRTAVEATS